MAAAATEGDTIETVTAIVTAIVVAIEDTDCPPIHPEDAIGNWRGCFRSSREGDGIGEGEGMCVAKRV